MQYFACLLTMLAETVEDPYPKAQRPNLFLRATPSWMEMINDARYGETGDPGD